MSTPVKTDQIKQEGLALISPLEQAVSCLAVTTPDEYDVADGMLLRITAAERKWLDKIDPIIGPIRKGLDALYDLKNEVWNPLKRMQTTVRQKMKDFKLEEKRQLERAEEQHQADKRSLDQAIAKAVSQAALAKTQAQKAVLTKAAQVLEERAEVLAEQPAPKPIQGTATRTRTVPKWKISNKMAFIQAVAAGTIDLEFVEPHTANIEGVFRNSRDEMRDWPGITIYEDIEIVRR